MRTDLTDDARELLAALIKLHSPEDRPFIGAEIGVDHGATSAFLLELFPSLTLLMVDSWATYGDDDPYRLSGDSCARRTADEQNAVKRAAVLATDRFHARRHIMHMDSVEAAGHVKGGSLTFAFVDGDHTYRGVRRDLAAWTSRIAVDGLLCGHDSNHPRDKRGVWGVTRAAEEFVKRLNESDCNRTYRLTVHEPTTLWWIWPSSI